MFCCYTKNTGVTLIYKITASTAEDQIRKSQLETANLVLSK